MVQKNQYIKWRMLRKVRCKVKTGLYRAPVADGLLSEVRIRAHPQLLSWREDYVNKSRFTR